MPSIVPFPGGLKGYLEHPTSILALRPVGCESCGSTRAWHFHAQRPRYTSLDGVCVRTVLFLVRCPCCRLTVMLLPDGMTPWLQHGTDTIRSAIETYVTVPGSYRGVALDLSGQNPPTGETRSVVWGSPAAPSPTPSTLFRWVARFAALAGMWWPLIAGDLQRRLESALRPPDIPASLPLKARTEAKRRQLQEAWYLLWALKAMLTVLERPKTTWPQALTFASRLPQGLEGTSWLPHPPSAPP